MGGLQVYLFYSLKVPMRLKLALKDLNGFLVKYENMGLCICINGSCSVDRIKKVLLLEVFLLGGVFNPTLSMYDKRVLWLSRSNCPSLL